MLDAIRTSLIRIINSTYLFIIGIVESLSFLDSPGTYILWMTIGLVFVPFLSKSIYYQYANPHNYYSMPLVRKAIMSTIFIGAWLLFGLINLIRFIPSGI